MMGGKKGGGDPNRKIEDDDPDFGGRCGEKDEFFFKFKDVSLAIGHFFFG